MLGSPFYLGRDFLSEEGQPGKDHVVILTHAFWKRLGANPFIIGTTMRMNDEVYIVVGVLAPGPADHGPGQVIVPLAFKPEHLNYKFAWLLARGRLKPGVSLQQAQANLDAITATIGKIHPERKNWRTLVVPMKNDFVSSNQKLTLWLLMGAVCFILLIACMNITNLLLARGANRQKEMAVRGALGATRRTIFSQLLTESLLLAILGGILGLGTGFALLRGLVAMVPPGTVGAGADLYLNIKVLLYTLAATSLSGILFGCAPAWYSSRVDPAEALKEGGRAGTGVGRHRLRRSLVIGEFALALTLLSGAGLAVHSFWNLIQVDLGVRTDHILTFHLQVPSSRSKEPELIVTYYQQILDSIRSVPGVTHAAATVGMPIDRDKLLLKFAVAGGIGSADSTRRPAVNVQQVTPDYLQTFGIRLVRGRMITDQDNASSRKVALVNEDFVKRFLNGTNPLKQRLMIDQVLPGVWSFGSPVEWQIVGVISTVRHPGNGHGFDDANPEITIPFWQSPWPSSDIGVSTAEDPASMLRSIATAVHKVDPQIALANLATMDELHDSILANDRFSVILLSSFAVTALLMAAVGIYGVMTFSVEQRSHEIALRMALGAGHSRVIRLVVKEGLVLSGTGLLLGLIGVSLVSHAMRSLLYGMGVLDLPAFTAVGFLLLLTALLACYLPVLRAISMQPMLALRRE
jgi:putative ABC transport system permease protein